MNHKMEERDRVNILRLLERRLDFHVAPDLKAKLLVMAKQTGANLLMDLAEVEYTDSSGLGAILFGVRQFRQNKGSLKLVNLQPRVLTLIKIAKLDNVIESYDNEDEAVASFGTA